LDFKVRWTNDGGTDDNTKTALVTLYYSITSVSDAISGDHANSPAQFEDNYASASGHIMHETDAMNIAHDDISGKAYIHMAVMYMPSGGTPLSCEPRMIGMTMCYSAKQVILA